MLNIRMSRTHIEGSPVPGCLTPGYGLGETGGGCLLERRWMFVGGAGIFIGVVMVLSQYHEYYPNVFLCVLEKSPPPSIGVRDILMFSMLINLLLLLLLLLLLSGG